MRRRFFPSSFGDSDDFSGKKIRHAAFTFVIKSASSGMAFDVSVSVERYELDATTDTRDPRALNPARRP
jgi:hypothetical protein